MLLAVNYRPEYEHHWGSKTYYRQLRIDPLPAESAEGLLDERLGADPSVEPLKPHLIGRTEGNPLFLEESVRALVETGALAGSRGAYRLVRELDAPKVPATVQAILAAAIDRLAPDDTPSLMRWPFTATRAWQHEGATRGDIDSDFRRFSGLSHVNPLGA